MNALVEPGSPEGRAVVVSGLGAISALGSSCAELWAAVAAGRCGIGPIRRFSTADFRAHLGATVPPGPHERCADDLCTAFALWAAREAWTQARGQEAQLEPHRIALVFGTSLGQQQGTMHRFAETVADRLEVTGPRITVSTACCSSTNAIGVGRDLLRAGLADAVLAGGADAVAPELFAGFHALGVMSSTPCAPFSEPPGMTLGEGGGFVVLERHEQAWRRGVTPQAWLLGYGLAADAYHETGPDPSGAGVARAVRGALADAGLAPTDIGYVNAHGTGTSANDPAEWRALCRVFGSGAAELPVSSSKSFLGHTQGAAGVLEGIVTALSLQRQVVPPTLHFTRPRLHGPTDPVAAERPRAHSFDYAICSNSAFGGANAALAMGRKPARSVSRPSRAAAEQPRRQDGAVWLLGAGAVGGHGLELGDLGAALDGAEPTDGRVVPFRIERLVRGVDPRGMDPSARFLTAAAAGALKDGGVRVRGALRDRSGIVVGAYQLSPRSARSFTRSIEERGLPQVSAAAFARMVLNAPAGFCALSLSLRGPMSTVTTGPGSGLVAIIYAAQLLASRSDVDLIVTGGVDELPALNETAVVTGERYGEGAACLLLANAAAAPSCEPSMRIRVSGWGLAGPGRLADAARQALTMAGRSVDEVSGLHGHVDGGSLAAALGHDGGALPVRDPAVVLGYGAASTSAFASVDALLGLRKGSASVALVAADTGRSAAAALVLEREGGGAP